MGDQGCFKLIIDWLRARIIDPNVKRPIPPRGNEDVFQSLVKFLGMEELIAKRVVTASVDCSAKIWSASSGECLLTLEGHGHGVNSAVFSPDGGQVLTASYDHSAKIWSASSGECLLTLECHGHGVTSAVFSPDGGQVLTVSYGHSAKIWSASSGECLL